MPSKRRTWWVPVSCLIFGVISGTDTAGACINGMDYRVERDTHNIAVAERKLNRDESLDAIRSIASSFPKPKQLRAGSNGQENRAIAIYAASIVRLDGAFTGHGFRSEPAAQRRDNLRWAAHMLKSLHLRRPNDAGVQTALGEALVKTDRLDEALTLLTALEADDRIVSARGFAALAQARRSAASDAPSFIQAPLRMLHRGPGKIALLRCKRMSRGADYCSVENEPGKVEG